MFFCRPFGQRKNPPKREVAAIRAIPKLLGIGNTWSGHRARGEDPGEGTSVLPNTSKVRSILQVLYRAKSPSFGAFGAFLSFPGLREIRANACSFIREGVRLRS